MLVIHYRGDLIQGIRFDIIDAPAHVDGDDIPLILRRALQDIKLAVYHVRTHVVALALHDTVQKYLFRRIKEKEVDEDVMVEVSGDTNNVSVLSLQS